jgi:hypothetical protein
MVVEFRDPQLSSHIINRPGSAAYVDGDIMTEDESSTDIKRPIIHPIKRISKHAEYTDSRTGF